MSRRESPRGRVLLTCALAATSLVACAPGESKDAPDDQIPAGSMDQAPDAEREVPTRPTVLVPEGTQLVFRVDQTISTDDQRVGDQFTAALAQDATDPQGSVVLPAGSRSRWVVTQSDANAGEDSEALLAFRLESLQVDGEWRPVEATVTATDVRADERDSGSETAAKVAVGAAAGAILGRVIGKNTSSTLKGAGVGAAVGTVVALTTRGGKAELPAGSTITVQLDESVTGQ